MEEIKERLANIMEEMGTIKKKLDKLDKMKGKQNQLKRLRS